MLGFVSEEEHVSILRELQSVLPDVELLGARKEGPVSARLTLRSSKLGHQVEIAYELEPAPRTASKAWKLVRSNVENSCPSR